MKYLRSSLLMNLWILPSCLSLDSPYPPAGTLPPGESSHHLGYHYLLTNQENPSRFKGSLGADFDKALPIYNLSYQYRQGLTPQWDQGVSVSVLNASYHVKHFVDSYGPMDLGVSLQAGVPILGFSPDYLVLKSQIHSTYRLDPALLLVVNPYLGVYPGDLGSSHPGMLLGIFYGGRHTLGLDYTVEKKRSFYREQVRLSYNWSNSHSSITAFRLQGGLLPRAYLGLMYQDWAFIQGGSTFFLQPGYYGLFSFVQMGALYPFWYGNEGAFLGLALEKNRYQVELQGSWRRIDRVEFILKGGFRSRFDGFSIFWMGYDMPILQVSEKWSGFSEDPSLRKDLGDFAKADRLVKRVRLVELELTLD
jgi:hypothetical protein